MFSVTLQWRSHYENITAKSYKILGLLHKIFKNSISFEEKLLYISLVRSSLSYCSLLWWPYLINSRHYTVGNGATMRNLHINDYTSDYKSHLIKLQLLPLIYIHELSDILFFIKSERSPSSSFNILNYVSFARGVTTGLELPLLSGYGPCNVRECWGLGYKEDPFV